MKDFEDFVMMTLGNNEIRIARQRYSEADLGLGQAHACTKAPRVQLMGEWATKENRLDLWTLWAQVMSGLDLKNGLSSMCLSFVYYFLLLLLLFFFVICN